MPAFIMAGAINTNTPQQNAGVWIGQVNFSGFDANMKFNAAQGGNFGVFSTQLSGGQMMFDNFEGIDGVVNDQDFKPAVDGNV